MTSGDDDPIDTTNSKRFYRIVRSNPPTTVDFLSNAAKGKRPRGDSPEVWRLWSGISVYDTLNRARENALAFPHLGTIVVELDLPDSGAVVWERTTKSSGHYTIWGDPDHLLTCVTAVLLVNEIGGS